MAREVVIDVEGRFNDNITPGADDAADSIKDIGDAAKGAKKPLDDLGQEMGKVSKKKVKPIFDADNSKFLKKIRQSEEKARKFGRTKTAMVLSAVDKATNVIGKVLNAAQRIAGRTWQGIVKAKDFASSVLSKVTGAGKSIAGKVWTATVKVKDAATSVLSKIKNSIFNIKTLIGSIIAGAAIKQGVQTGILAPIAAADSYSGAKIGFSTLLGEQGGQKMMDDLDAFAKKSPFDTSGVISNAQKMLAMGWNAEDIVGDMEIIGNAAASTGNLNQGLESIVRAMAQIKTKGKLSAEELNQLAEAGISAKAMLAEELGYGTGDAALAKFSKDQEDGLIGADRALEALLNGMKKYDGMMDQMANETAKGLMLQLKDTFEVNIVRRWGQGLQDGAKRGLGSLVGLLDKSDDALQKVGDTLYEIGKTASNWAADKLEGVVKNITKITESADFKDASLKDKVKMLWSGAIANPFAGWWNNTVVPWWDSTVVPWLAEKAGNFGETLGKGLSNAITTLFNLDTADSGAAGEALETGKTIGGSFLEGFLEGFDTEQITEALKGWVERNKGVATGIGVALGVKLLSGLGNIVGNIKGLFGGGGSGGLGSGTTGTMDVTAAVVNVYGGAGKGNTGLPNTNTGTGLGGKTNKLPSGTGTAAATGGAGFFGRLFGSTGNAMVGGSGLLGKLASVGYSLTGGAAGSTLSGGAAAAAGGGSILGGVMGALGIGSGVKDIWQGTKTSGKEAKDKYWSGGTKIGLVGTGAATGAAIGSVVPGVGTAVGALVGAGVGGTGALLGGTKLGKWFSDATDEGGSLNNAWKATKGFFTDTIPEKWNKAKTGVGNWWKKKYYGDAYDEETGEVDKGWMGDTGGWIDKVNSVKSFFTESIPKAFSTATNAISEFFTQTIPEKWGEFWDGVSEFFTETIPDALSSAGDAISEFFTETIPEKWGEFWKGVEKFLTQTLPYALGYVTGKIHKFFNVTVPEFFKGLWDTLATFFTETLPEWAEGIWNDYIHPFFTEKIPAFFGGLWSAISTFFTETLPEWAEGIWNDHIHPFFTETIPGFFVGLWGILATFFTETLPEWAEGVWSGHIVPFFTESIPNFFSSLWSTVSTFFTETIPEWASGIWNNNIVPFFTESIPNFFSSLWNSISTFFTETIPDWASNIWNNNIVPFFTESIPNFFSNLWNGVTEFFDSSIEFIAEAIWSPIKTFFTETIPGWVNSAIDKAAAWWDNIKINFKSGFSAGSGEEDGEGFRGGIFHPAGSNAPGFAGGGIVRGGARLIKVAEEGTPEMIIPLGSHRRERGMKLWAKAGEMLGVDRFARGGLIGSRDNDEGTPLHRYEPEGSVGGGDVRVDVGGVQVEIHVDASGNKNIVEAIREQGTEIAETVAGILVDAFSVQFPNAPVRGGA